MPTATQGSNLSVFAGATGVFTGVSGGRNIALPRAATIRSVASSGFRTGGRGAGHVPVTMVTIDDQKSILAGVRVERPMGRFHPYGGFLDRDVGRLITSLPAPISIPRPRCNSPGLASSTT